MAGWGTKICEAFDSLLRRAPRQAQAAGAGAQAERAAEAFLRAQGARILERNARYRGGELDLVILDGAVLAFVEVRLRHSSAFGGAAASITPRKQRRVQHAARCWLQSAGQAHAHRTCRFDAVLCRSASGPFEWLRDAFGP